MQQNPSHTNQQELFARTVLQNWNLQNERLDTLLKELADEDLARETAPGRNTGVWLLGHLTAVSDAMMPLLGFRDKMFPELQTVFIDNSDKSGLEFPATLVLRELRRTVNSTLDEHFKAMQPADWFNRHLAVSEGDFALAPHRNKISMVINRTAHLAYHLGQLVYLKK